MDFTVKKRELAEEKKYPQTEVDLAYAFARKSHKEFGTFLRAVVLFGSIAEQRPTQTPVKHEGDIDLLIIVDDVTYYLTPEVVEAYRVIVQKLIGGDLTTVSRYYLEIYQFLGVCPHRRSCRHQYDPKWRCLA